MQGTRNPSGRVRQTLPQIAHRKNQPKNHPENAKQHRGIQQQQKIHQPPIYPSVGSCLRSGAAILVVQVVVILGPDVRHLGKVKNDRQHRDYARDANIRNIKRLAARVHAFGVLGIEIHAPHDRTKNPANAVCRLGQVDARSRIARIPQYRRVRIGYRLQKCQPGRNAANAEKEAGKRNVR